MNEQTASQEQEEQEENRAEWAQSVAKAQAEQEEDGNSDTRVSRSLAQNHYVIKVAITAGKAKIEN